MSKGHYNYRNKDTAHLTRSQRKRESYNYRAAYFRKNPGLFGFIWFCSQCGIPMLGRENVQVDHIIPLAGFGINRTINTVAICPRCNREKSDKGGKYVAKGLVAKIIEVVLFTIQKIILNVFVMVLRVLHFVLFGLIEIIKVPFELLGFNPMAVLLIITIVVIILFC